MLASDIIARFRVADGSKFRLADFDPGDTCGLDIDKREAKDLLEAGVKRLSDLQERLYAEHRWALLVILQGLDTAGKDSAIKHVMSGVNPQGCEVHSFKAPSDLELAHDYLWRSTVVLPRRGHIGIFNRSYYEEVLVVRVHPKLLAAQPLPPELVGDEIWTQRFADIAAFERYLVHNGTVPLKFFLHISKQEQRERLLARIDEPDKRWKFRLRDLEERKLWKQYLAAYEDMIRHTATPEAPWYVIPADRKWFSRLLIGAVMVESLERIDPQFPKLDPEAVAGLEKARAALLADS